MDGVTDLVAAINEAVDATRKTALAVGYSEGAAASQARIDELQRDNGLQKAALAAQDRRIEVLEEALQKIAEVCNGYGLEAGWACRQAREALAEAAE
jgi:hypothetical protein